MAAAVGSGGPAGGRLEAGTAGLGADRGCGLAKAISCWQWANFLAVRCSGDKPVLRVNLDESSLKLYVPPRPGLVFEPCAKRRRSLLRREGGPDLKTKRSAVTLIAFVCDDERVQRLLPQIFVTNERVITQSDAVKFAGECCGNVVIVRRKSAWVDAGFAREVVEVLATCLSGELARFQIILHMDTLPAHMHVGVLKACCESGIHVHFIPAKTTGWLQPLDVLVFSVFKGWVVREVERLRLASVSGLLTPLEMLGVYRRGVEAVIQSRGWAQAFELTGLRGQSNLSRRLLDRLRLASSPIISNQLPKFEDFETVFPVGKAVRVEDLFGTALANEKSKSAVKLPQRARLPRGCSRV